MCRKDPVKRGTVRDRDRLAEGFQADGEIMAEYNVGDKVILKDDGQSYTVVGVRTEDHTVLFDLEKGDQRGSVKLTVLRSQLEVQKVYSPKYPQTVIYKFKVAQLSR